MPRADYQEVDDGPPWGTPQVRRAARVLADAYRASREPIPERIARLAASAPLTPKEAAEYLLPWVLLEMRERRVTEPHLGPEWSALVMAAARNATETSKTWARRATEATPEFRFISEALCRGVWEAVRSTPV